MFIKFFTKLTLIVNIIGALCKCNWKLKVVKIAEIALMIVID